MDLSDVLFGRLLDRRIVVVGAEVTDDVASVIISQLLMLNAVNPAEEIQLFVNSPGGSVPAGFAIYDTMRIVKADISTYAVGKAMGIAQFILSSGTPGKRFALPDATITLCRADGEFDDSGAEVTTRAELHRRWAEELARITAEQTGQPPETIAADSESGRSFTAVEARDYGIVDHVATSVLSAPTFN